jgi:SP family general alpha glucoside:H+ symporter-like MFS transporter
VEEEAYISTCYVTTLLMLIIEFLGLAPDSNNGAMYAKSIMLLLFNFVNNIRLSPIAYVLIARPPNIRIRGKTLCIAYFVLHIFSIPITAGLSYPMGTTEVNSGAKTAFLFAGLNIIALFEPSFACQRAKAECLRN